MFNLRTSAIHEAKTCDSALHGGLTFGCYSSFLQGPVNDKLGAKENWVAPLFILNVSALSPSFV